MQESIESRAVKIAAGIMTASGMCLYEDPGKCRKTYGGKDTCDRCIEKWLLKKARQELRNESDNCWRGGGTV